ncbi:pyridoxal phosphate-dependent aminotransferase [Leptospira fluminis]|uniref:Pyridoxal phosphate-dependent aminotransferase n=1 Tax=Leptospira fluminis TaxID=2484979 RepID=A0A4V3JEU2_9LEPT|nr:pyridoxal phosphate-dependent aminotransferase [Leptospira fluminis]TGK21009.1 pyridoxal phosphate-dependent aminotransferase [Leptospira fluminis]
MTPDFLPKFSDRFDFEAGENPLYSKVGDLKKAGTPILDLTVSNPTRVKLSFPGEAILHSLTKNAGLVYEPEPQGSEVARNCVAEYYRERGLDILPEDLFLTSSSSEAYSYIIKLLCDPGDEILIPSPGYPLFEFLALLEGVKFNSYRLDPIQDWKPDFEGLKEAVSAKTKLLFLVSPNNPTGSTLSESDFSALVRFCESNGIGIVLDEVFCDYFHSEGTRHSELHTRKVPFFRINGISKILALPQMKLSWIHVDGPESWKTECKERLEIISDTYLSVASPIQHALSDLMPWRKLIQGQVLRRISRNLKILSGMIPSAEKIRYRPPMAGWYAVLESDFFLEQETFCLRLLEKEHTLVHPGCMFGFPEDHPAIVLSLLPETEIIEAGIAKILDFVAGNG